MEEFGIILALPDWCWSVDDWYGGLWILHTKGKLFVEPCLNTCGWYGWGEIQGAWWVIVEKDQVLSIGEICWSTKMRLHYLVVIEGDGLMRRDM